MLRSAILTKYKLHHLVSWVIVLAIWYFLRYEDYRSSGLAFHVTLIKVLDLALMIYITNGLLIPKLLYKKRYAWFTLAFILLIVLSSVIKMNIIGRLIGIPWLYSLEGNLKGRIYDNVIPHFFLVTAGAAVKLLRDHGKLQQHMATIAKEKAEAELNFLKSQINPHFLFNSINSVFFLIDKNNREAREALSKFSDMLRYQLYEMNDATIPIEKEISYLQDYVDLQKLRKDENYSVVFNCTGDVKGFFIEPLLLIPFVENAFKHISHYKDRINYVNIDMRLANREFCFTVENSKEAVVKKDGQHSGIGLNNVNKRLGLLYPGRHRLGINNNGELFRIDLSIQLNQ